MRGGGLVVKSRDADGQTRYTWTPAAPGAPTRAELEELGFGGSEWVPAADATHLLLLLHGLGDGPRQFAQLARTLALPSTAALALRGPIPLPFGVDGACWHASFEPDGELIAPSRSEQRRLRSLADECRPRLAALVALLGRRGWPARRLLLFGYAQGGTAALDLAMHLPSAAGPLGGVVSYCGHPPAETLHLSGSAEANEHADATPCLVVAAAADPVAPLHVARELFKRVHAATGGRARLREVGGAGAMARSEAEWRPVMEFFAERLETSSLESDPSVMRVEPDGDGGLRATMPLPT